MTIGSSNQGSETREGTERHERLLGEGGLRVDRITSNGYSSPVGEWFDQDCQEWVTVLEGEGVLGFEDGTSVTMKKGEHLVLAAHRRHRIVRTSLHPPCVWLAVYYDAKPLQVQPGE
jgi:cupin 2 domain-containing protein